MSGITGIFRRDGQDVDPADIKKMNDKIAHRGPDGSRVWCEGPVAFGHQMLHTTQESLHEILPFEDKESGLVITADARIDNRKDLAPLLGIEDNEYVSDSYFILKAYEKWGEKCPEELLGDFAFAIWDKNKEELFCVRDHIGIKQFYYYISENCFYFSTEIKAIFTDSSISRKLNELKLILFLTINTLDKLYTFYEGIVRLLPSHSISIYSNRVKITKYWELEYDSQLSFDSDDEYLVMFKNIFAESIKCRLRSTFPVGFELSGGLDSSSVVCMARELNKNKLDGEKLNTFSYVFNDFPEVDERFYINKVLDNDGIEGHFVYGDNITPVDNFEEIWKYQDQPFYTPNLPIIWQLRQQMKKNNIRILLSGDGGDEVTFSSARFLRELAVTFQWKKLLNEIRMFSNRTDLSYYKLLLVYFMFPLIPNSIKKFIPKKELDMFQEGGTSILNSNFVEKWGKTYFNDLKWKILNEFDCSRNYHYLLMTELDPYILEMNDVMGSAFSIEPRYPYFDKRLVEFYYALPDDIKFKGGLNRFVQRFALKNILPSEIQLRSKKTNFNPVYEKNLFTHEEIIKKIINNRKMGKYIDLPKIAEIYQKYKLGQYKPKNNDIFAVWLTLLIDEWFKHLKINK